MNIGSNNTFSNVLYTIEHSKYIVKLQTVIFVNIHFKNICIMRFVTVCILETNTHFLILAPGAVGRSAIPVW